MKATNLRTSRVVVRIRLMEADIQHKNDIEMAAMLSKIPSIELLPMSQRMEIKDGEEDWTGKSSTAERRKLQNRLNQRALRRRKLQEKVHKDIPPRGNIEIIERAAELYYERYLSIPLQRPSSRNILHMDEFRRRQIVSAPNFESFVKTPLPSDQKLLTLMHFNFVRALAHNVFILGFNPDEMDSEVESPFTSAELKISTEALPETLRPTELQKIVPHHPGLDLFPFPRWRDNMLRRGWTHPKNEYSVDLLYGVESEALGRDCGLPGRTGLIAWGESWLQESWEIEEGFARKYSDLFDGCEELLESTNQWRARRGEGPLILKVEEDEWES